MNFLGNIISGQDIVNKDYVDEKVGNAGGNITVDTELSETSENPIANKTVAKALSEVADAFEGKQNTIADLDEIRAGAAKGATAIQSVKTINGQSIVGSGNVVISADASNLATKEEVQSLTNETIDDEEVLAHAINDLNNRVNELAENVSGEAATKVELADAVSTINATINANDERYEGEFSALDDRIDELAANVSGETVTKVEFKEEVTNITNEVIDDEEVLAYAINDLKSMIDALTARVNALESNNA